MKHVTCSKHPEHTLFERTVIVQGPTVEVLYDDLSLSSVEDCRSFELVRRTSPVSCYVCGAPARISLTAQ